MRSCHAEDSMRFGTPRILWLFWITMPLLCWFLWWAWRKKQSLITQFIQTRLLENLTVGVSKRVQKTRLILVTLAVGLLILTLGKPQWGFAWEEARQRGLDLVVAIDTSRSMLAADISPNRLERAKLAALDLMRLAKNDRLGLVAFAGTAFLQCPLTLDDEAFRQSVNALDVGIIPQGGTALAEAIDAASKAFKDEGENHKVIVLFTDGEDHEAGAIEAAKKASEQGIVIFTVGIGTPNGELLQQRDESGSLTFLKDDQGNAIKSRLNESLLTQMATSPTGFYLPMSGATTMDVLYQRGLAPLPKSENSTKLVRQFQDRYYWPLALAMALLLLELFLPDRKQIRRVAQGATASTNAELRKAVLLLLLSAWPLLGIASPTQAQRSYEAGRFKEAEQQYERLIQRKPDDPKLHYNAGAAAYQAGAFEKAASHFGKAMASPDLDLQQRTCYNMGNSLFRLGQDQSEPPKKIEAWEQSVKQYEAALKLNPQDKDSQFNLDFVKEELKKLKQQQQDDSKNDPSDKDDKKDEDNKDNKDDKGDKDDKNQKEGQKDQPDQKKQSDKSKDSQGKDQKQEKDKSKDSKSKDQKGSQDRKDKDQKNDQSKKDKAQNQSDEKKSDEQKKQEQAQESKNKEKKDGSKSAAKGGEKSDQESEPGQGAAALGQMTPEQVQRLLDSQKSEEKAMIFVPQDKSKGKARIFKDW
jgi:Ca-activated chloride channel family protein